MKKQTAAGWLIAAQFISAGEASAETPCDVLRGEYLALAAQHPEMTEDTGDGNLMMAVVGPTLDGQSQSIDCSGFRSWLKAAGLDASIVADLERDDFLCYTSLHLYDHRKDGGFVALAGSQGSAHCPVVQVLNLDKNRLRQGWTWGGECAPASFEIVRIAGRAYPMAVLPKIYGTDLSYRMELISVDPSIDGPLCSVSITYLPQFIGRWFGPKGENDVDPDLRRVIDPILPELASGRDAQELVKPWLDRPQGDGPYDLAISGYPERPIEGMRFPNTGDHVYRLPWGVPYLGGKYEGGWYSNYGSISSDAAIPLAIAGRRLLLLFGYAGTPGTPPPDAGFGVYEYNDHKRDFDGVAGGVVERHGINPRIE